MGLDVNLGGEAREIPEKSGNYIGTVVGIIDCGTNRVPFKRELKDKEGNLVKDKDGKKIEYFPDVRRVAIQFELGKKSKTGQPLLVELEETNSFFKTANLPGVIKTLTGELPGRGFAFNQLLGKQAMCEVEVKKTKSGHDVANVKGISSVPEGFPEAPAPVTKPYTYSIQAGDTAFPPEIPYFILTFKIKPSYEYRGVEVPKLKDRNLEAENNGGPAGENLDIDHDKIPF